MIIWYKEIALNRILIILIMILILLTIGCQSDIKEVEIDFDKTEVPQPPTSENSNGLSVAVSAMTSPKITFNHYIDLLNYIGEKAGREVRFKQRKTYREINELLCEGQLDLAFICSGAYVAANENQIHLLAAPIINGKTTYQSYLLVSSNSSFESMEQLKGKDFSYTDSLSMTGYLYPRFLVQQLGYLPENYFGKTLFTHGHDKAIQAVARGMTHGACIDGLIFDYLSIREPEKVARVKVIGKSEPFGIPPVVVPSKLDSKLESQLREILLNMHLDKEGKTILTELMIDRFVVVQDSLYDSIRKLRLEVEG